MLLIRLHADGRHVPFHHVLVDVLAFEVTCPYVNQDSRIVADCRGDLGRPTKMKEIIDVERGSHHHLFTFQSEQGKDHMMLSYTTAACSIFPFPDDMVSIFVIPPVTACR
jgi:hypothetical protein